MIKTTFPERIIDHACLLFAEHGYESVDIPKIADTVDMALDCFSLFFVNKETIYEQVFRRLYDLDNALTVHVLIRREPTILDTPEGMADAVRQVVTDYFRRHIFLEQDWQRKLIRQERMNPSPLFRRLTEEGIHEESQNLRDFHYLICPDGGSADAFLWSHIPATQAEYYFNADGLLERYLDTDIHEELREAVIRNTARLMTMALELPEQAMSDQTGELVLSMTA